MGRSKELFSNALGLIPGGVNSPVRAFKGVGGDPIFFARGSGPYIYDVDGREHIDYVGSWGPMILGHAHPDVISRVQQAANDGLGFGTPTEIENTLAAKICELVPTAERVRMVNSGTEAAMTAIRLARGITGRDKIIKFEGCYHGHADSLLVKAGSGALTLGIPTSPGVPAALAALTITLDYNDLEQVEQTFVEMGEEIAAIIVEPIAGNMNCVPPKPGFLEGLRRTTQEAGALLIFDEVMTGFRVALGGAQALFHIEPDLTILGKVVGGGMPVGAIAGPAAHLEQLAPTGPIYQAGTLSGNPIAMTAGLATLELVAAADFHEQLMAATSRLVEGIREEASYMGVALTSNCVTGMFGLFFTDQPEITSFADVMRCDQALFQRFYHNMLELGVYLAPSAFEVGFVSAAHNEEVIDKTLTAARQALKTL